MTYKYKIGEVIFFYNRDWVYTAEIIGQTTLLEKIFCKKEYKDVNIYWIKSWNKTHWFSWDCLHQIDEKNLYKTKQECFSWIDKTKSVEKKVESDPFKWIPPVMKKISTKKIPPKKPKPCKK